jgi:hypothetical protein
MIIIIIINNNVTGSFRHYSVPYVPEIEGIEKFKGLIQHSKAYRSAEAYRNLRVVVLGAASSGMDIAMEVAAVADEVRPPYLLTPAVRALNFFPRMPLLFTVSFCLRFENTRALNRYRTSTDTEYQTLWAMPVFFPPP